ncbi:Cell number regulator 6 [Platanthera guangdongensis]|uniref:Cell number regulator 6 n=1 Tax=Platanthera guangdongensis TaxID=2320717 RepID=A0ABR2MA15_9ASPA
MSDNQAASRYVKLTKEHDSPIEEIRPGELNQPVRIPQLEVRKCNECGQPLPESYEPPADEPWTTGIFGCAEDPDSFAPQSTKSPENQGDEELCAYAATNSLHVSLIKLQKIRQDDPLEEEGSGAAWKKNGIGSATDRVTGEAGASTVEHKKIVASGYKQRTWRYFVVKRWRNRRSFNNINHRSSAVSIVTFCDEDSREDAGTNRWGASRTGARCDWSAPTEECAIFEMARRLFERGENWVFRSNFESPSHCTHVGPEALRFENYRLNGSAPNSKGWTGLFCPCVLFGRNLESIKEDISWRQPCALHAICVEGGIALAAATAMFHGIDPRTSFLIGEGLLFSWWMCGIYTGIFRQSLQKKYHLKNSPGDPCMTHCCLHWCAICQEHREMKARLSENTVTPMTVVNPPAVQEMSSTDEIRESRASANGGSQNLHSTTLEMRAL